MPKEVHTTPAMPRQFRTRSKWSRGLGNNAIYNTFDSIGKALAEANAEDVKNGVPRNRMQRFAY